MVLVIVYIARPVLARKSRSSTVRKEAQEYPSRTLRILSVTPSPGMSDTPVEPYSLVIPNEVMEPYNAASSSHRFAANADESTLHWPDHFVCTQASISEDAVIIGSVLDVVRKEAQEYPGRILETSSVPVCPSGPRSHAM